MYTLTVSGTYDASVVLGATGIVNRCRTGFSPDLAVPSTEWSFLSRLAARFEYPVSLLVGGCKIVFLMGKGWLLVNQPWSLSKRMWLIREQSIWGYPAAIDNCDPESSFWLVVCSDCGNCGSIQRDNQGCIQQLAARSIRITIWNTNQNGWFEQQKCLCRPGIDYSKSSWFEIFKVRIIYLREWCCAGSICSSRPSEIYWHC